MSRQSILVWDWPVRIGHWLMVGGFSLAWLTAESERWRLLHVWAGAVVVAVALFRLVWGLMGTRYARFTAFLRGPAAVQRYLTSMLAGQPEHHTGHNPAGGWAIVLLLGLGLATGWAGWANYNEWGGEWLEELHEGLAATMLMVVVIHLGGVLTGSFLHGENLVRAMFSGRKQGRPEEAIPSARWMVVFVLLAWVWVAGRWLASTCTACRRVLSASSCVTASWKARTYRVRWSNASASGKSSTSWKRLSSCRAKPLCRPSPHAFRRYAPACLR